MVMAQQTFLAAALAGLAAAVDQCPNNQEAALHLKGTSGSEVCMALIAGRNKEAGEVCVTHDPVTEKFAVAFNLDDGYAALELSLWLGDSKEGFPVNRKGRPQTDDFPFQVQLNSASTHTFSGICYDALGDLDIYDDLCSYCTDKTPRVYMMAFAVLERYDVDTGDVLSEEHAWADGESLTDAGRCAKQSQLRLRVCCQESDAVSTTEQPVISTTDTCETAFAFLDGSAQCFLDIDENNDGNADFSRWGWSNALTVEDLPAEGVVTMDLYAGAGGCNRDKGVLAGTATVTLDENTGCLHTQVTAAPGYALDGTHMYIGDEVLPLHDGKFTIAPGQFVSHTELNAASSTSHETCGMTGDVYVVVHAVVCGEFQ